MQSRHNIFELGNGFPTRHGTIVFQCDRKLFADSFLLDMAPLCFCQQETICEGFPVRRYAIVFLTGRKLFAKGFLFDMALPCFLPAGNFFAGRFLDSARNDMGDMATLCFLTTGNCLRRVSSSTWHYCVSYRQETICEWFPVRHGNIVFQCDRKLFAKGFLVVMAPLRFLPAGNHLRRVSWST